MTQEGTEPWTIKRLLTWTGEYLSKRGAESPRLDAEVLLSSSLDCERIDLYARFADIPDENHLSDFREKVKQRAAGMPVAYLVGYREFYSLRFRVTKDVLVPRPETEFVVLEAIDFCRQLNKQIDSTRAEANHDSDSPESSMTGSSSSGATFQRIDAVDVGTGSGCLAVALAHHVPELLVQAVDLSEDALEVARQNIETHKLENRITLSRSDVMGSLPAEMRFDLIVSNPPYIGRTEQGTVDPNVARFEPQLALYGGDDGMQVIRRLVEQAAWRLKPKGHLIFEISPMIAEGCEALVRRTDGLDWIGFVKDLDGNQRVAHARKAG